MGLLDDAIREHLDLKRRRGADPAEIERAEREALGPVRRNREPGLAEDAESGNGAELDPALGAALDEPDEGTAADLVEESDGAGGGYAAAETSLEDEDLFGEDEFVPADHESFVDEDDEVFADEDDESLVGEEDPHPTQLMSTVDVSAPEDATAEHDVEETFVEEDGPGAERSDDDDARPVRRSDDDAPSGERSDDEDMLEETPEFLQDTPDHDRLWFEQRPPRDFDFDG